MKKKLYYQIIYVFFIFFFGSVKFIFSEEMSNNLAVTSFIDPMLVLDAQSNEVCISLDPKLIGKLKVNFQQCWEQMYSVLLSKKLINLGLSSKEVDVIIKKHIEQIKECNKGTLHAYQEVIGHERIMICKSIIENHAMQIDEYARNFIYENIDNRVITSNIIVQRRFLEGVYNSNMRYNSLIKLQKIMIKLFNDRIILKDEKGIIWLVKNEQVECTDIFFGQPREKKNFKKHEMFAYLMAKGISNLAEIRFLRKSEIIHINSFQDVVEKGEIDKYYLVRMVVMGNLGENEMADKVVEEAFPSLFVADIFMHKWDSHLNNIAWIGDIPFAIDHDETYRFDRFQKAKYLDLLKFSKAYFYYTMLHNIDFLIEVGDEIIDDFRKNIITFQEEITYSLNNLSNFFDLYSFVNLYGFDKHFYASRKLFNIDHIKRIIVKYKSISLEEIYYKAVASGFKGDELVDLVNFVKRRQKVLAYDIGFILSLLGEKKDLIDQIDDEFFLEQEKKKGKILSEYILLKWYELNKKKERLVIAIDTSFLNKSKKTEVYVKNILCELRKLCKFKEKNIIIVEGKGMLLIKKIEGIVKLKEEYINKDNLIVIGDIESLELLMLDELKKMKEEKLNVFFVGLKTEAIDFENSYIEFCDIILLAMKIFFSENINIKCYDIGIKWKNNYTISILPKTRFLEKKTITDIYRGQIKSIVSA